MPKDLHKESGPHQMPRWPWPGLSHWCDLWACPHSALGCTSQSPHSRTCAHFTAAWLTGQMLDCVFPAAAAAAVAAWGPVELTACLAPSQASLLALLQNSCLRGQTDNLLAALLDAIVFWLAFDGTDCIGSGCQVSVQTSVMVCAESVDSMSIIRPCHILKSFKSSRGVDKPTRNHLDLAGHDEPNSLPGQGELGPIKKHKENSCIFGYPSAGAGTRKGISFSPSHITTQTVHVFPRFQSPKNG